MQNNNNLDQNHHVGNIIMKYFWLMLFHKKLKDLI